MPSAWALHLQPLSAFVIASDQRLKLIQSKQRTTHAATSGFEDGQKPDIYKADTCT